MMVSPIPVNERFMNTSLAAKSTRYRICAYAGGHSGVRTKPLGGGRCAWVKRGSRRGNFGVTEGGFCDPITTTHAGGTPATQLYQRHDPRLHPGRGAVRPLLP